MSLNRCLIVLALSAAFIFAGNRASATAYGTLSNFDVINDTAGDCHGFEIELDGITTSDVVYTFGAPNERYGDPSIEETGTGIKVRYAATYDVGATTWTATTPFSGPPYLATGGHSCWFGAVANPNDYLSCGCDHFGMSLNANPTATRYHWLVESSPGSGTLIPHATDASLPVPVWTVTPQPPPGPGLPPPPPVVEAVIAPPPPVVFEFGEAIWAKVFTTELTDLPDGDLKPDDLDHMVLDDPGHFVPNEPAEVEIEWMLIQASTSKNGEQLFGGQAGAAADAVSRRFEFYKYIGDYDPENHEALCDVQSSCPEAVGDMIGAQNVAVNLRGQLAPPPAVDSTFTTGTTGWSQVGTTTTLQSAGHDPANQALLLHVNSSANDFNYRIIGWLSAANDTLKYAAVSSDNYIRSKYYIFAQNQTTPTLLSSIPNFRLRVASRFAFSAILQPYNHDNAVSDPEADTLAQDIRPSTSPLAPSVYRVDLDPAYVPQLVNNPNTEGFIRMFEAYEATGAGNGDLEMSESTLGIYPALLDSSTTVPVTENGLLKSYLPGATDGGDFGNGNIAQSNSAITILKYHNGVQEFTPPLPSVTITSAGVTLETLSVETDRLGVAALDVFNDIGDQANHLTRARIEPGKQYKFKFHATSTKQSNTQALMRFRARTIKFLYTANLEVGSSHAQPSNNMNNVTAAQVLPGTGNQLPAFDRIDPSENGGWYNVIMVSPMTPDIQPDQPHLYAQDWPGMDTSPGNNSKSRRDLEFGFDVIDTFSNQPEAVLESGQMTVDRVDIEKYDLVAD